MRLIVMNRILLLVLIALLPAAPAFARVDAKEIMISESPDAAMLMEALADSRVATRRAALLRITEEHLVSFETVARATLHDPAWSVRRMACRALEFIGTEASRASLEETARNRDSAPVRARAVMALGRMADPRSLPALLALLDDDDFAMRGTAAQQIGAFGDSTLIDRLNLLAESDSFPYVRVRALESIKSLTPSNAPSPTAPAVAQGAGPAAQRFLVPALLVAAALLFLLLRRRRKSIPAARMILVVIMIAGVVILFLFRLAPDRHREMAGAYELILDPSLAQHPLVELTGGPDSFLERIASEIRAAGLDVDPTYRVAVSPELEAALDPLRGQYDMNRVLDAWAGTKQSPTPIVITNRHLFVEPFYTVLGRAGRQGGVISTRWIDPIFLGETEISNAEAELFRRNLAKLLIHELGHARGLPHCNERACVMRSVEEAAEEFHRLDATPCAACRATLAERMKAD